MEEPSHSLNTAVHLSGHHWPAETPESTLRSVFGLHFGDKHQAWLHFSNPITSHNIGPRHSSEQAANAVGLTLLKQSMGRGHCVKHLASTP